MKFTHALAQNILTPTNAISKEFGVFKLEDGRVRIVFQTQWEEREEIQQQTLIMSHEAFELMLYTCQEFYLNMDAYKADSAT